MPDATLYARNPDFIYRKIVEESVLVPLHEDVADMNCIYTLNGVGAFIWEQLSTPMSQADLQTAMLEEYTADPIVLLSDLESFLGELIAIGALRKE